MKDRGPEICGFQLELWASKEGQKVAHMLFQRPKERVGRPKGVLLLLYIAQSQPPEQAM